MITVVGIYVLDFVAEHLNLRALDPSLPERFREVFDSEKYLKSQAYTRETTRFGLVASTFSLVIFLVFWLIGGFGWLANWTQSWGWGEVATGLAFISILFLANVLLSLPFSIYENFVIEEKYGFNKMTGAIFAADKIKGLVLGAVIGLPILGGILWLFETFPNAWIWAWVSVTVISLLLTYIAPRFIMPLFNKFEPLEDGELKSAIDAMAKKCEFPLTEISVIDGSKRSTKANAFFTGFGKNRRIALYDTLMKSQTTEELVAVLAHEIGHFKKKHILQQLIIGIIQTGFIFFLLGLLLKNPSLHDAFGVKMATVATSLVFFMILFKPVEHALGIFMSMLSRKNEFEADAYARQMTGSAAPLMSALKKLSVENFSNLTPHPFFVFMNYSHPPVLARLEALEKG